MGRPLLLCFALLAGCTEAPAPVAPTTPLAARCGDGRVEGGEGCDDGNATAGDGCSDRCVVESLVETCGDGVRRGGERCDDGNTSGADGCSSSCSVTRGWQCQGDGPSRCGPLHGDGLVTELEACDDGGLASGDGCDASSSIEEGWACDTSEPSRCTEVCGDGRLVGGESCDDGNTLPGDDCSPTCLRANYWRPMPVVNSLSPREFSSALWTGSKVFIWGGNAAFPMNDGALFDPVGGQWTRVNPVGAPSFRSQNAACWTGSEALIWGGGPSDSSLRNGARYNPETDSWRPISATNAPSARDVDGVWTGSEMIIIGGRHRGLGTTRWLSDGARYDPEQDRWTRMSAVSAPSARYGASKVWTGTELIVWGGDKGREFFGDGAIYDPQYDTWRAMSRLNAPVPRTAASAVWTGNEMIVWGGEDETDVLRTGGRYDPVTDTWTPLPTAGAPSERGRHSAVWTGSEMVVMGGHSGGVVREGINDGGVYIPAIDAWSPLAARPVARFHHAAVWTGSEMFIWGGTGREGVNWLDDGEIYDPATMRWRDVPQEAGLQPLDGLAGDVGGSELLVFGWDQSHGGMIGARYSVSKDVWRPMADVRQILRPRVMFAHVWAGSEQIIWGGAVSGPAGASFYSDGARYRPADDTWTRTSSIGAPSPRIEAYGAWTGSHVIIWGGVGSSGPLNILGDGARYDPVADVWSPMSSVNAPAARLAHTEIWTGSEYIVFGGYGRGGPLADGASYDPATDRWTRIPTAGAPRPRYRHTSIWTGKELIVYGGLASNALDDGGRYDPIERVWRPLSSDGAPGPRAWHSATWTGQEMMVWGGRPAINDASVATGARYDPVTDRWRPMPDLDAPSPRLGHVGAWVSGSLLIYGGGAEGILNTGAIFEP